MSATARLGENTVLLHFAVKLLKGKLKGVTGINSDLTHRLPARSTSILGTKSQQTIVYCALCQQTVIYQRNSARYNARRVYYIQYPKSLICGPDCTFWPRPRPPTRGGLLKRTGRQRLSSVMPLLSSFNLSNS